MANKTIAQIKAEMTDAFMADKTIQGLYGLNENSTFEDQFSKVSIESILFYVVAAAIWSLSNLWILFQKEVDHTIAQLKPHSLAWYRNKVLDFRYGQSLMDDADKYSDEGLQTDYINKMKIVAQAAVIEILDSSRGARLRIKAVKSANGELAPLNQSELDALIYYVARIKDAGVPVQVDSAVANSLKLNYEIWYDPLVLNDQGELITTSGTFPVKDTIYQFLRQLKFNGEFRLASLTDALQATPGVVIPEFQSASYQYGDQYFPIDAKVVPDAGYLKIFNDSADLILNYKAYEQ